MKECVCVCVCVCVCGVRVCVWCACVCVDVLAMLSYVAITQHGGPQFDNQS